MIGETTLIQASEIAAQFAERNLILTAVQDTPLASLVDASTVNTLAAESFGLLGKEGAPSFEELLLETTNKADQVGQNVHSDLMDDAIAAASGAIEYTSNLTRNVVNPIVERVAAALEEALVAAEEAAISPISVKAAFDSSVWELPYIDDLFGRYIEIKSENAIYRGPAVVVDKALFETGLPTVDAEIARFIQDLNDSSKLKSIWESTFGGGRFETSEVLVGEATKVCETALVVYLAANSLENAPPEDTNMSLVEWTQMLRSIKLQAARTIAVRRATLERSRARRDLGVIYPPNNSPGSEIVVDGVVYNKFLEEGGTPEVLLGSHQVDRNRSFESLLERKDEYEKRWDSAQATMASLNASKRLNTVLIALETAIHREYGQLAEEHVAYSKPAVVSHLGQFVGQVRSKHLDDLFMFARKAVCRILFPHTNAEAMLCALDEAMAQHPNLSGREAALYAVIELTARWLSGSIVVSQTRV